MTFMHISCQVLVTILKGTQVVNYTGDFENVYNLVTHAWRFLLEQKSVLKTETTDLDKRWNRLKYRIKCEISVNAIVLKIPPKWLNSYLVIYCVISFWLPLNLYTVFIWLHRFIMVISVKWVNVFLKSTILIISKS